MILVCAALLGGCVQTGYLVQAAEGELDLLKRARPITTVLRDGGVSSHVRRVLIRIHEIRRFARSRGLEPARSYESYVDLRREAVVWVVQAAPPLSFEQREWSFPIVGSVPYLGYFDRADADAFAAALAASEGLDVDVRRASAFSTLGWLDDPVLSTMIREGPEAMGEFANVILHESVHATIYLSDQSAFDETLATFVGDKLTHEWLSETFGPNDPLTRIWLRYQEATQKYAHRLRQAWTELDALYKSDTSDAQKLEEKARVLAALQRELGATEPINNATLAGYRTYDTGADAFARLFETCGRDWKRFLDAVGSLRSSDFPEAQSEDFDAVLDAVGVRRCGPDARAGVSQE